MKEENMYILKKSMRQRRAISSNLFENGSYNYSEEEKNKSKNSIKSFHRKTTSSYFCGSYLSSNLEDGLINNIKKEEIYSEKNKNKEKEKENINNSNLNNDDNLDMLLSISLHSYDSDNKKVEENNQNLSLNIKTNKITKEEEKKGNEIKKTNNFISFKNNLKNIKDKDERQTKSYLLALGMTKYQNSKEQYIPTVSVIEEEKSDVIESKSEFSNKKIKRKNKNFFENNLNLILLKKNEKLKIRNIFAKNRNLSGLKNKVKIERKNNKEAEQNEKNKNENNKNEKNKNEKSEIKLSFAFDEIILKNTKKEENKRKYLKKNKTLLLNCFFSNSLKNKEESKSKILQIDKEKNQDNFKKTENIGNSLIKNLRKKMEKRFQFYIKEKIKNSCFSNFIKKRYNTENNDINKGSFKNKILAYNNKNSQSNRNKEINLNKNYNLNDTINSNLNINKNDFTIKKTGKNLNQIQYEHKSNIPIITKIEYRPWVKIPHLRHKMIEKKEVNSISNMNETNTNINKSNISKKNTTPNRKFKSKYKNIPHKKSHSFNNRDISNNDIKEKCCYVKKIKSFNESIEIIKIERIKSKSKDKSSKKLNELNLEKNKNKNSSFSIKPIYIMSKSSREKEKNQKISIKKTNSGTFRNDISLKLIEDKNIKNQGNKNSTFNVLKFYLKYDKEYIKKVVLKKIEKASISKDSFYIIICKKIIAKKNYKDIEIYIFQSLMKYNKAQNKFIKIYGYEKESNSIHLKNINKFEMFLAESKETLNDRTFLLVPINELKFDINAIILFKK